VERRGARERRFPITRLKRLRRTSGGAVLTFPRARLAIPAVSHEGLRPEPRPESFEALLGAVAAQAHLEPPAARSGAVEAMVWIIALMGVGALALLAFAAAAGAWRLGVALAARLVFVLIFAAAVLPWLRRR
jgi:hypothetical protein